MENNNVIEKEYKEYISSNPDMKFILYVRIHPHDETEKYALRQLSNFYGEYKELNEERVAIFIIPGSRVEEFTRQLASYKTKMYISFIQSDEELKKDR